MKFWHVCQKFPLIYKNLSAERFSAILRDTSKSAYYRCGFCLLVLTLLSISAQWAVAPVPLVVTPNDFIGFIDAGFRITSGQVPHNDFSTQFGPAFSYVYAIGVGLFGPTISAIVSSNLLVMTITTLLAWLFSCKRLSPFLALIFSATVMSTTSGVVPLGWGAHETDYAMSYNRHAYGILMCICVGSFFKKRSSISKVTDSFDDLLIGALVSLLLLLKLNFFVIGVCALVISQFFVGFTLKKSTWTIAGFLVPILFFWLVLGVKPYAFFNDMSSLYNVMRETRSSLLGPIWKLVTSLKLPLCTVLFILIASGWLCFVYQKGYSNSLVRSFVAAFFLLTADLVLGVSNTQLPILVFLSFIALIALRELLLVDMYRSRCLSALIMLTFLLSIVTVVRETSYIAYAFSSELSADPVDVKAQRFDSPLLGNVYAPASGISIWANYPQVVNDGLRLLRRYVVPGVKLVTLNITNPFDFVLGLKPANGTQLFWWFGASYTDANLLRAEQVFSNADIIVVNKDRYIMPFSYSEYLRKRFKIIDESQFWVLLKRDSH